jgi:phage tail-like protein
MTSIRGRDDPYLSFKFLVEIQGLVVGGFSEVTGLQAETEFEEVREGGVNDRIHKIPKATKYSSLILKRGMTNGDTLWKWYQDAIMGLIQRRSVFVILLDEVGGEAWRWCFLEAYPAKWVGPDLKADGSSIAVETMELAHEGIKKM